MGSIAREEGVLKLVHPGGFIEIHRKPVMASQVMAKNPRHLVTRPDVFRFPYIFVRPESVLNPGNVFFIVPCKTLYRLLKPPAPAAAVHAVPSIPKSCLKSKETGGGSGSRGRLRVRFFLPVPEGCIRSGGYRGLPVA